MNEIPKSIFMFVFAMGCFWDGFTTVFGTTLILSNGEPRSVTALIPSLFFAVLLLSLLLSTERILNNEANSWSSVLLKILLMFGIIYDVATSWWGNATFISSSISILDDIDKLTVAQIVIIIGVTVFSSSSPIFLSFSKKIFG